MTEYTKAQVGNRFCLTDAGKKISRVRAKFILGNPQYKKGYQHSVPTAWVKLGWVKEEKEQTDGC